MTRNERWIPYLFLLPAIAGLLVFRLLPMVYAIGRSFYTTTFGQAGLVFVGSANYSALFSDPTFWQSLRTTLIFNVVANPLQTVLALMLAVLVSLPLRGIGLFRTLLFAPVGVSITVATIIWGLMLDPDSGLINGILIGLHLPPQPFFTSPDQALLSIVVIATWKGLGYWMLFFLAGLQSIPQSLYEAAAIDGATRLKAFWYITLPLLRRVIAFVLVADTTINFLLFAPVYVQTQGGPQGSTNLLMYEAYRSGFQDIDMGRATSITTILLLLILVIVAIQLFLFSRGEDAQG